jgi:hypothetical protein
MKFTVSNYSAGNIHPIIAGAAGNGGANITANGTYSALFVVGIDASNKVHLRGDSNFIGHVDNVSVHKLTWGRQITDDSTNYSGFQYALPIDEFDFAIPVDYVAESIVAQQFHNGIATSWDKPSGLGATSIVTGNGFSGKAQRVEHISGTTTQIRFSPQFTLATDDILRFTFKYRADDTFRLYTNGTTDLIDSTIAANTGDAIVYTVDGAWSVGDTDEVITLYMTSGSGDRWLEFDEVKVQRIIDGEFYEPEAIGGDPVIINTNYFAENPSRYLTRYFNAVSWKDLLLLKAGHSLDYTDHAKLMRFTKNS